MEGLAVRVRNQDAVEVWAGRIRECKNSDMHTAEWCAENGINIKTYYYWHNKIRKMISEQAGFYEVPVTGAGRNTPAATLRVGMLQADIYPGADSGLILSVCQALKRC